MTMMARNHFQMRLGILSATLSLVKSCLKGIEKSKCHDFPLILLGFELLVDILELGDALFVELSPDPNPHEISEEN